MVTVSTQAQIALRSLHPRDRERVQRYIARLDNSPQDAHIRQKAKPLNSGGNLYLLRVTSALRIIFKWSGDSREVVDIVAHDRLERMQQHTHQA